MFGSNTSNFRCEVYQLNPGWSCEERKTGGLAADLHSQLLKKIYRPVDARLTNMWNIFLIISLIKKIYPVSPKPAKRVPDVSTPKHYSMYAKFTQAKPYHKYQH